MRTRPIRVCPGRPTATAALLGGLLLLLAAAPAAAREKVVVYRCTDASGAVTLQNDTPCPKGSKQERRVMEAASPVAPPAAPVAPAAPIAPAAPAAAPAPAAIRAPAPPPPATPSGSYPRGEVDREYPSADSRGYTLGEADGEYPIAAGERLPPPSLYVCRTFNDQSYLAETSGPHERCVTVSTSGLGGGLVEAGAGTPCETRTDECVRVPDEALCDHWRQRLREAESALQFGTAENRAQAEAEARRIKRVVRDSTCGL